MGGDITFQSELGKGSCFTFTARMKIATDARSIDMQADSRIPQAAKALCNPSYRVLLAEDNDVNAIIATAFLTNRGMACERVESGDATVYHALRTTNARMSSSDGLPDASSQWLGGDQAVRERERKLGLRRIPVIALTALSGEEDRQACFAPGMDAVLSKPFTEEELSRTVSCWLSEASAKTISDARLTVSA